MSKSGSGDHPLGSADTAISPPKEADQPSSSEGMRLGSQSTLNEETGVSALGDTVAPAADKLASMLRASGKFPVVNWERYEFLQLLGKGGMGAVYKARDPRLNRLIALKFIHSGDDQMILRFMQEARAQARIDHPGICKVYEVGEVEDKAYIAMQFISGPSLQQAAKQLPMPDKAQVIRDAALALHAAHELGIIHRVRSRHPSPGANPGRSQARGNRSGKRGQQQLAAGSPARFRA